MNDIQNRIEAILFTTGRFMDLEEISRLCGIGSIGLVKENIEGLKEAFKSKESSLEIIEDGGKFKLGIRKEYVHLTAKLLSDTELDRPTQETLAIIAYKQPIMQSDVIKIRGNTAYDHIHNLKETKFIVSEKCGRTRMLKASPKFYEYFDTALDSLKADFTNVEQKVGTVQKLDSVAEAKANEAENREPAKEAEQETDESKEIEDSGNEADEEESVPAEDETAEESESTKTEEEQDSETPESDKKKEEPEECSFDL